MKPIMIFAAPLALALLAGCAGSAQVAPAEAPRNVAAADDETLDVIVPDPAFAPPGTYEMDWEPTEPPPAKEIKPRKMIAKPHMVSEKRARGRLFVLPTTYEH
jgi:hypothetical protein